MLPADIEFVFVKCESMGKTVYKNTHAVIRERPNIRQRLNELKEKSKNNRPLSVLMLSIDSVSRLNLIRAMPKTAQHLYDSGWFELQGYNKVTLELQLLIKNTSVVQSIMRRKVALLTRMEKNSNEK